MAPPASRRQREKEHHRDEIFAAAETVFAEKGFHRATVEEIAALAEFSVGTLYNFFPGKEELYWALVERRIGQLAREMNALLGQATDPVAAVREYVAGKIALFGRYLPFVKLYTRERLGDRLSNTKVWQEKFAPLYRQTMQQLAAACQKGIDAGVFRPEISPADMAIALDGLTDAFMFEALSSRTTEFFEKKLDTMLQLFLDGVRRQ